MEHPNAQDWRNRCERAEAEAAELRAELNAAVDALRAVKDCDLSDPVDYARRADAIACEALARLNWAALA